ncbi:hypothetical protein GC170_10610 [bacterium]|nr:hypothetical protein [bacterium]
MPGRERRFAPAFDAFSRPQNLRRWSVRICEIRRAPRRHRPGHAFRDASGPKGNRFEIEEDFVKNRQCASSTPEKRLVLTLRI